MASRILVVENSDFKIHEELLELCPFHGRIDDSDLSIAYSIDTNWNIKFVGISGRWFTSSEENGIISLLSRQLIKLGIQAKINIIALYINRT